MLVRLEAVSIHLVLIQNKKDGVRSNVMSKQSGANDLSKNTLARKSRIGMKASIDVREFQSLTRESDRKANAQIERCRDTFLRAFVISLRIFDCVFQRSSQAIDSSYMTVERFVQGRLPGANPPRKCSLLQPGGLALLTSTATN
jgi:hypothetical protein